MRLKKLSLPFLVVAYRISRITRLFSIMPMSVSLYTTYRCNSRCLTCNIWQQSVSDEMTISEIEKTLRAIGRRPLWFTITGGESFLRDDLVEIITLICKYNRPLFINIATNGLSEELIVSKTLTIADLCKKYQIELTINVSLDELFEGYDKVRGTVAGFERVVKTFKRLKKIKSNGSMFNLGTNTTLSKFNIERFEEIYRYILDKLKPNSVLFEMASIRSAFFLKNENISPEYQKMIDIADFLFYEKLDYGNMTAKLIQRFRKKYYRYIKGLLLNRKKIPCYAGIASAEIISNGNVVTCCARADVLGSLRDENYDFRKIWHSPQAYSIRRSIARRKCACDLSNIFYTNSIISMK